MSGIQGREPKEKVTKYIGIKIYKNLVRYSTGSTKEKGKEYE